MFFNVKPVLTLKYYWSSSPIPNRRYSTRKPPCGVDSFWLSKKRYFGIMLSLRRLIADQLHICRLASTTVGNYFKLNSFRLGLQQRWTKLYFCWRSSHNGTVLAYALCERAYCTLSWWYLANLHSNRLARPVANVCQLNAKQTNDPQWRKRMKLITE